MSKIIGGKELAPVIAANVENNSIFLDVSDNIIKMKGSSGNVKAVNDGIYSIIPSDNQKYIDTSSNSNSAYNSYIKLMEVTITGDFDNTSSIRVKFDLKGNDDNFYVKAKIYKNGTSVTNVFSIQSEVYETQTADVQNISTGDTIEIWGEAGGNSSYRTVCYVANLKILFDEHYSPNIQYSFS